MTKRKPLTPEAFAAETAVSRETLARLEVLVEVLRRWQKRINLVSPESLVDVWRRHVLDSVQLLPLIPPSAKVLVDLGSGGGFPGLVLAILWPGDVYLVESDRRKCIFLAEAARATETQVVIHGERIETVGAGPLAGAADVVTARALAPLERLLELASPFLAPGGVCLFPKGARVDEELTAAGKTWTMPVERFASRSDPSGTILRLGAPARATP